MATEPTECRTGPGRLGAPPGGAPGGPPGQVRRAGVLGDRDRADRVAGRQADGRGEERRVRLPARLRRVNPGADPAAALHRAEPEPRGRGVRPAVRADPGRPGQDRRRRPVVRPAARRGPGDRAGAVPGSPGRRGPHRGPPGVQQRHHQLRVPGARHRLVRLPRAGRLRDRPGGQRGRLSEDLQGHRLDAALRHPGRGYRPAAADLPQPGPVAAADHLGRRLADRRRGGDLPAGRARGTRRQRADRGHPGGAGARRLDRLRAAADRPVPRGAAQA